MPLAGTRATIFLLKDPKGLLVSVAYHVAAMPGEGLPDPGKDVSPAIEQDVFNSPLTKCEDRYAIERIGVWSMDEVNILPLAMIRHRGLAGPP